MADPVRGTRALASLLDASADPEDRFEGMLLLWSHMRDMRLVRMLLVKGDD